MCIKREKERDIDTHIFVRCPLVGALSGENEQTSVLLRKTYTSLHKLFI